MDTAVVARSDLQVCATLRFLTLLAGGSTAASLQGGNRVRVNAQLISAVTGAHLWADQFDISTVNARARRVTIATIDGVTH
jgi:TolB-like protein